MDDSTPGRDPAADPTPPAGHGPEDGAATDTAAAFADRLALAAADEEAERHTAAAELRARVEDLARRAIVKAEAAHGTPRLDFTESEVVVVLEADPPPPPPPATEDWAARAAASAG